jgi:hypothetical protein
MEERKRQREERREGRQTETKLKIDPSVTKWCKIV